MELIKQASHTTTDHFGMNAMVNNVAGNSIAKDYSGVRFVWTKQLPLIISEFSELSAGLLAHDLKEIRDGAADVIVTAEGMIHRLGIGSYGFAVEKELTIPEIMVRISDLLIELNNADSFFDQNPIFVKASDDSEVMNSDIIKPYIALVSYMYSLSNILGLPVNVDQEAVFESNMSKFDTDLAVAEQGLEKYRKAGIDVRIQENFVNGTTYYIIKSAKDQIVNGKDYPEGKFLKSVNFFEPRLAPIDVEVVLQRLIEQLKKKGADQEAAVSAEAS